MMDFIVKVRTPRGKLATIIYASKDFAEDYDLNEVIYPMIIQQVKEEHGIDVSEKDIEIISAEKRG